MNPHFVYNTMNAVFLAQMDKERNSALRIINRYGQLFRSVFEHAERETIELREEIEFLSIYLEMEQLRFSDRISVVFDPDQKFRDSKLQIPPMLIQPLVENAFKHGLFHKEGKGCLKVSLVEDGDQLIVSVEDDGVGRQYSQKLSQQRRNSRSITSENILLERIEIFNSRANSPTQRIGFKVQDLYSEDGKASGTLAQLSIPLLKMKHQ